MINEIESSELTVYKKHCTLYRNRNVLRRLCCQQTSSILTLQLSQYALIYNLLHQLHNS